MIDNEELEIFLYEIRELYGYDFTEYAKSSLKRRLQYFMKLQNISEFKELSGIVMEDESKFENLVQSITVNVTEMFRDPSFYKSLRNNVTSRLATYPFIKIWIAGCATGEEAYSMAILLKEENLLSRSVIYATDINQKVLQNAKEGIYTYSDMQKHTANYIKAGGKRTLSEYYTAKYDSAIMDKSLKENIVFSVHNLTIDKSFNEFQIILCRNVLIYFNQSLQNKVINLFYESLCMFGHLALGTKESLYFSDKMKHFDDVDKKEKIFIKNSLL